MRSFPEHLRPYIDAHVVQEPDLCATAVLVDVADRVVPTPVPDLAWIAMALALSAFRDQHVCIDFGAIHRWQADIDLVAADDPSWPLEASEWIAALQQCPHLVHVMKKTDDVSVIDVRTPFVLFGSLLYVTRAWDEESFVFSALNGDEAKDVDVLLGGPGSGKTTTVARQLIELFTDAADPLPVVALAAPTGKAAQRMTEALQKQLHNMNAPESLREVVSRTPATTLHRLLGASPNNPENRFTYNHANRLPHDVVIIDETSMLSLSLMHKLLQALRDDARLLLVGDPYQLASVDAGTVLADIDALSRQPEATISSRVTFLAGQYRFAPDSPIAAVADAVRRGNVDDVFAVFEQQKPECAWIDPLADVDALTKIIRSVTHHAQSTLTLAEEGKYFEAVRIRQEMQVLCAIRRGRYGVSGWNNLVERQLGIRASAQWYVGRPVIVTTNDKTTGLFNGDVGVVCSTDAATGNRRGNTVAFPSDHGYRMVTVTRMPEHDTVHALTIHKSQGSEYDHVVVVLPDHDSRIVTRELLYTAITRARKKVTIIGSRETIEQAVRTPIVRATGLSRRLLGNNQS